MNLCFILFYSWNFLSFGKISMIFFQILVFIVSSVLPTMRCISKISNILAWYLSQKWIPINRKRGNPTGVSRRTRFSYCQAPYDWRDRSLFLALQFSSLSKLVCIFKFLELRLKLQLRDILSCFGLSYLYISYSVIFFTFRFRTLKSPISIFSIQ